MRWPWRRKESIPRDLLHALNSELTSVCVVAYRLGSFKEPDAPPNSVERPLLDYEEDDFISTAGETEGIELF